METVIKTVAMRFAMATLGCKVNQYDSAMIESRLGARGMERCEFDEIADVYIVNTCTITDRADAESLKLARRARRLNPRARVVMTGCLAQANPAVLAASPEIDAMVGLGRPDDLERAVLGETPGRVMVTNLRKERAPIELGAVALEGRTASLSQAARGVRSILHLLYRADFARNFAQRRAAAHLRRDRSPRGFRLSRGDSDRRSPWRLRARPRSTGQPRDPARYGCGALADRSGQDKFARPRGAERPYPGNHGRE